MTEARRRQRVSSHGVASDGRRILLTRLTDLTSRPGWWTLPGGGIDHGEHPRDALVREFAEETSLVATVGELIDVDSHRFVGTSPEGILEDYQSIRIVYRVEVPGEVEPMVKEVNGTTDEARWVDLDAIEGMPLTDLALLGVAHARRP